MARRLIEGCNYKSASNGVVMYLGRCDCERSNTGWCYKFVTSRSKVKYILPEELDLFLGKEE